MNKNVDFVFILSIIFCTISLVNAFGSMLHQYEITNITEKHTIRRRSFDLSMMHEAPCQFDIESGAQICNCGYFDVEMFLPKLGGNIFQVNILNCKMLLVKSETFSELLSIAKVTFSNIENLILESNALKLPYRESANRLQLQFFNTIIEELPSHGISGNIEEINFDKCKIGIARPFAITGLIGRTYRISVMNSVINRLEPQAMKKFSVGQLIIQNSEFSSFIPSRAIYDIDVTDLFSISNCNFSGLFTGSFMLKEIGAFRMQNNRIDQLSGSSFQMQVKEAINIENNQLIAMSSSAFESITLDAGYFSRHSEPLQLEFTSNFVNVIDRPIAIKFAPLFNVKHTKLYFMNSIDCSNITILKDNEFFRTNAESIYFKTINSTSDFESDSYQAYSHILHSECVKESYLLYIIIGIVILLVIVLSICILLVCLYWRKRRAQQLNVIQPEGRTYRETQIVMQIENAGLLKTDL